MLHKPLALGALLIASGVAQAAADADLEAIRVQIADMKKNYEQRIAALEQKLAAAEAKAAVQPLSPSPPVTAAPDAAVGVGGANRFNPEISLILQGKYKRAKDIPDRRLGGFFPSDGSGDNGRGFSVDESELVMSANVDPYWRGQAVVAMADGRAEVEEAWFQSLGLGYGFGLKAGRFRSGIGYLNEQHLHAQDFADVPLIYRAMFGDSYVQDGVQAKWLAPLPLLVEFGAEAGRGGNFPGTDRNRNSAGSKALYVHVGDDAGDSNSWRTGVSWLRTSAAERSGDFVDRNGLPATAAFTGDSTTWLADFVWKWAPHGNPYYRNFKFQAEYFRRKENGDLTCGSADAAGLCATPASAAHATRQSGWYTQAVYQFTPNWRAGARYDRLDSGRRDFGDIAALLATENYRPQRASAMVDYSWSEFSRARLQYAQDRSIPGLTDHQWTLQYIMSLGAHGAHKF